MSHSRGLDPSEVARIFMELPEEVDVSDNPDFDRNEGDLDDGESCSVVSNACSIDAHANTGDWGTETPRGPGGSRQWKS